MVEIIKVHSHWWKSSKFILTGVEKVIQSLIFAMVMGTVITIKTVHAILVHVDGRGWEGVASGGWGTGHVSVDILAHAFLDF